MTLLFSLAFLFSASKVPTAVATVVMPSVSLNAVMTAQPPPQAVATIGSAPLDTNGNNAPAIQNLFNTIPPGCTVAFPNGVWTVNAPVQINKTVSIEAESAGTCTIKGVFAAGQCSVFIVGSYGADVKANGVAVKRLTLEVDSPANQGGPINCLFAFGDSFLMEDCILKGSAHEGVAVLGSSVHPIIRRNYAENCGHGNAFYSNPTAAFNVYAYQSEITDNTAKNCGQGYECGGNHVTVRNCTAENCGYGFNAGSHGGGIWETEIGWCKTINCGTAVTVGNGIGRLANVNIHDCVFDGGIVNVMGGVQNNQHAPMEGIPVGPDTGQSHCDRCVFILRGQPGGTLGYNTGPGGAATAVYGREPWTFDDNQFFAVGQSQGTSPIVFFAGHISAPVTVKRARIFNLDAAPTRGDVQTFWTNGQPPANFTLLDNLAIKSDGLMRPFAVNWEVAP